MTRVVDNFTVKSEILYKVNLKLTELFWFDKKKQCYKVIAKSIFLIAFNSQIILTPKYKYKCIYK